MAFLVPDKTETINGVVIKTKIIPITAKMNKDTGRHKKGDPFRDQRKINGTGKATYLTIHNTPAIKQAAGTTMSEQYSRATYPNQAMSTTRVHYYTDAVETWQNLPETDVSWHAGETANLCSISIEVIGDSAKAEDNGARLAAMRLIANKIPIERMVTHNKWMGLPDKVVVGAAKNCPFYILPHWPEFVSKVIKYMQEFSGKPVPEPDPDPSTDVMYRVQVGAFRVKANAERMVKDLTELEYFKKTRIKPFIITVEDRPEPPKERKVKVNTKNGLHVRKEPTSASQSLKILANGTVVTITEEKVSGSSRWGYASAHKGWISLDYVINV